MKSLKFILGLSLILTVFACEDEESPTSMEPVLPETIGGVYTNNLTLVDRNENPNLADYIVSETISMDDGAGIIIEPGVVIEFEPNTRLQLGRYSLGAGDAYIIADGTASNPIVFRGTVDLAGSWNGILIGMDSYDIRNSLNHCVIENAGGANGYAIRIENGTGGGNGLLSLTNSTIRNSSGNGLESDGEDVINEFYNNLFDGNADNSILINAQEFSHVDSETRFINNGTNGVVSTDKVYSGRIWNDEDHIWRELDGGSYYINRFTRIYNGSLTIEAGTELIMGSNTGMASDDDAYITAIGTPSKNITFRGINPTIPSWDGIFIYSKNSPNTFQYCRVSESGADGDGAFHLDSPYTNCCGYTATITNCIIQNNGGCGIYTDEDNLSYLTTSGNSFENNVGGTLCYD